MNPFSLNASRVQPSQTPVQAAHIPSPPLQQRNGITFTQGEKDMKALLALIKGWHIEMIKLAQADLRDANLSKEHVQEQIKKRINGLLFLFASLPEDVKVKVEDYDIKHRRIRFYTHYFKNFAAYTEARNENVCPPLREENLVLWSQEEHKEYPRFLCLSTQKNYDVHNTQAPIQLKISYLDFSSNQASNVTKFVNYLKSPTHHISRTERTLQDYAQEVFCRANNIPASMPRIPKEEVPQTPLMRYWNTNREALMDEIMEAYRNVLERNTSSKPNPNQKLALQPFRQK